MSFFLESFFFGADLLDLSSSLSESESLLLSLPASRLATLFPSTSMASGESLTLCSH